MDHRNLTGSQIAAARALADLSQAQVAAGANISVPTLKRMEGLKTEPVTGNANNILAVMRVLTDAGVQFLDDGDTAAGSGVVLNRKDRRSMLVGDAIELIRDGRFGPIRLGDSFAAVRSALAEVPDLGEYFAWGYMDEGRHEDCLYVLRDFQVHFKADESSVLRLWLIVVSALSAWGRVLRR